MRGGMVMGCSGLPREEFGCSHLQGVMKEGDCSKEELACVVKGFEE